MTKMAVFDLDYKGDLPQPRGSEAWQVEVRLRRKVIFETIDQMKSVLSRCGARSNVTISRGGIGAHIQIVLDQFLTSASVIRWGVEAIREAWGYQEGDGGAVNPGTELFPKQNFVRSGHCGSHIALPFYNMIGTVTSPGLLRDECVPQLELTSADVVPQGGVDSGAAIAQRITDAHLRAVRRGLRIRSLPPARYTYDPDALRAALIWFAGHGDTELGADTGGTPIGLGSYEAWRNGMFACKNEAERFPTREEIKDIFDEASRLAADKLGANYDLDQNEQLWDAAGGRTDGITVATIYAGARQLGYRGQQSLIARKAGGPSSALPPHQGGSTRSR